MAEPAEKPSDAPPPDAPSSDAPSKALSLDALIHERVRLGIVSALAGHERLAFTDLRDALGLTDGNLSAHARKLEEAGYLACHKSFVGRTPRTEYSLTRRGREELSNYLEHLEAIIDSTRGAGATEPERN